ncbi:hydrolase [Ochrobactrum sp. CM-21-5]|nr:hydrolase [Ochrobactrum sp. CM-21-5]MBC2884812.1 hydrolase [Ochrobactrum sp. CM-21-5]
MPKTELRPRQDRLVDQYREIGPAVLVAALNAAQRTSDARNDNRRQSILAIKKPG